MNVNRVLQIREGDAVAAFRLFISRLWQEANIDAMLLPMGSLDDTGYSPRTVTRPEDLADLNPYAPIMTTNSASMVGDFLGKNQGRLAALLRPCELRALVELEKRRRIAWNPPGTGQVAMRSSLDEWLLIIAIDCPGTLTAAEFNRRVSLQGIDELTRQALAYGQKNGLKTRQLRTACQICDSIRPQGADITIGLIGADGPTHFLAIARDENIDGIYHLDRLTDRLASEAEIVRREVAVGKITDDHRKRRESMYAVDEGRFDQLCSLLASFSCCTLCADCLDACPIYEGELTGMLGIKGEQKYGAPLLSELVGMGRWLASCSGCGMCQEACEHNISLITLISALSHHIQQELHYIPGEPTQSLPWRVPSHAPPSRKHMEGVNVVPR
jgi:formate dehydrogenase subunit beta